MKKYENPMFNVIGFESHDVIATSEGTLAAGQIQDVKVGGIPGVSSDASLADQIAGILNGLN